MTGIPTSKPPEMRSFVLMGATGNLSLRMLFPAFYHLEREGRLATALMIVATARSQLTEDAFRQQVYDQLVRRLAPEPVVPDIWKRLFARLRYVSGDMTNEQGARDLGALIRDRAKPVFYLAVSPSLYAGICRALGAAGLAGPDSVVCLEKPIGRDRETSIEINTAVAAIFAENCIFRIDHYLGKETVQNLLALRFANAVFEPLWNSGAVDHVEITVMETEGVGERLPYYDDFGALRDVVQNHMLQLLTLVAMEPPSSLSADAVRAEKVQVLRSLRRITPADVAAVAVRGQYTAGLSQARQVPSYTDEHGSPSDTETFVALRVDIDNWRWAGVPFYLRTGKRMPERRTQIVVQFKGVPHSIFGVGPEGAVLTANRLLIDLQPDENISLTLMNKRPGFGMALQPLPLSLSVAAAFGEGARRRIAYERLFLDILAGEPTLFVGREEVEEAWSWIDELSDAWSTSGAPPSPYPAGSWGPASASDLFEGSGRR